jgi:hypothetical protein
MMLAMQTQTCFFYFFGHITQTPPPGEQLILPD